MMIMIMMMMAIPLLKIKWNSAAADDNDVSDGLHAAYKSASTYFIQKMACHGLGMHISFDSPVTAG